MYTHEENLRMFAVQQAVLLVGQSGIGQKEKAVFDTAIKILDWITKEREKQLN